MVRFDRLNEPQRSLNSNNSNWETLFARLSGAEERHPAMHLSAPTCRSPGRTSSPSSYFSICFLGRGKTQTFPVTPLPSSEERNERQQGRENKRTIPKNELGQPTDGHGHAARTPTSCGAARTARHLSSQSASRTRHLGCSQRGHCSLERVVGAALHGRHLPLASAFLARDAKKDTLKYHPSAIRGGGKLNVQPTVLPCILAKIDDSHSAVASSSRTGRL